MTEDDAIFDPTMKKKKKKKKPFDLDAAMGGDNADNQETGIEEAPAEKVTEETENMSKDINDMNFDDDLTGLKKKKKKKKPFDLNALDDALPKEETATGDSNVEIEKEKEATDAFDEGMDLDLSLPAKKKKKKKILISDDVPESEEAGDDKGTNSGTTGLIESDRDYTYEELLKRVFDIMREKNPEMMAGEKKKFNMKPPRVQRVGAKKTAFTNFKEICKILRRNPEHLLAFLFAELGTSGSIDGNDALIIKGRFQEKQIENVLRGYIREYVTCHTCKSKETSLQKDTRLYFLQCETCGSRCSVQSIKSGFQAVTSKRAAIRAKTN